MATNTRSQRPSRPGKQVRSNTSSPASADLTERIRLRAHSIWESEGAPGGRHEDHWFQAEHEILHEFDQLDGDDIPNLEALREAAREHTDAFIVATDLIDADQREATPGMREQL
jgi:hypothetical protein